MTTNYFGQSKGPSEEERETFNTLKDDIDAKHLDFLRSLRYKRDEDGFEVKVLGFRRRGIIFLQYGPWTFSGRKRDDDSEKTSQVYGRALGFSAKRSSSGLDQIYESNPDRVRALQEIVNEEITEQGQKRDLLMICNIFSSGIGTRRTEFKFLGRLTELYIDCNATYHIPHEVFDCGYSPSTAPSKVREHAAKLIKKIRNGELPAPRQYSAIDESVNYVSVHGLPENEDLKQLHSDISGRAPSDGKKILKPMIQRIQSMISNPIEGEVNESDRKYIKEVVIDGLNKDLERGFIGYTVRYDFPELETPLREFIDRVSAQFGTK
jgi:hypothetical protein